MRCPYPINRKAGPAQLDIKVPCGQCICCRITQRQEKATRLLLESLSPRYNGNNLWITLTYAPEHYPQDGSVSKQEMQMFMKRVRNYVKRQLHSDAPVRYALVGEYGSKTQRAHYHVVLFGINDITVDSFMNARSKLVETCWTKGLYHADNWSSGRCEYLAGYITKKFTSESPDGREPEFYLASKHPMLGIDHVEIIANAMKTYFDETTLKQYCETHTVPSLIRIEGKLYPLDKFFRQKLREELEYTDDNRRIWALAQRQREDPSWGWDSEHVKKAQLTNGQKKLKARAQREKI